MSIVDNKVLFDQARHYLNTLSGNSTIRPDCEELRGCLETAEKELNPATNRNYALLSTHRKQVLIDKVAVCVQKIDQKLPKSVELPAQTALRQHKQVLDLIEKIKAPLSSAQIRKMIKEMDHGVATKIYLMIWLSKGCSKQNEFGRAYLERDVTILTQELPELLVNKKGTLLQQIAEDLKIQHQFLAQKELCEELGSSVRQEQIALLHELEQKNIQNKIAIFQKREQDVHFSHSQLKALFRLMPPAAQAKLPKPPYYGRGFDSKIYTKLGAHYDGYTQNTTFRLYAPNAQKIDLVLTAFGHVEHTIPLLKGEDGIWTAQTPHALPGRTYHFMIVGAEGGDPFKKLDPFAFGNCIHSSERHKENHESVVRDIRKPFPWNDQAWMEARKKIDPAHQPINIYEVHVPSWQRKDNGDSLNWRELATELGQYCQDMGYTHLELFGFFEHIQPKSMGYRVSNFFCPNSKMGTLEDFQFFVNEMHRRNIGVFIDWIPAHLARDPFALANFDGTPLLEGERTPQWGTYEFDFQKQYTWDYLGSNLAFLFDLFHIDGIRADAVTSMLELDFSRLPRSRTNEKGGTINLAGKAFLRNVNTYTKKKHPDVLLMAEESSDYPNLTRSVDEKGQNEKRGVGYDLAWQMGYMNDFLRNYMLKSVRERCSPEAHLLLTNTLKGVDGGPDNRVRGKVVLPWSHDECAMGHKSIKEKAPVERTSDKFANGRLILAYPLLRGGGPILNFMGNEILQSDEWHGRLLQSLNPKDAWELKKPSVQWEELDPTVNPANYHYHQGAQEFSKALNHFYLKNPGLWDHTDAGISWIDAKDYQNSVFSFHRRGNGQQLACILNFSDHDLEDYLIPLPGPDYAPELVKLTAVKEVFNSDSAPFAGEGRMNETVEILCDSTGQPTHFKLRLPPFTAIVLAEEFAE